MSDWIRSLSRCEKLSASRIAKAVPSPARRATGCAMVSVSTTYLLRRTIHTPRPFHCSGRQPRQNPYCFPFLLVFPYRRPLDAPLLPVTPAGDDIPQAGTGESHRGQAARTEVADPRGDQE